MSKLTTKARNKLPSKDFAGPDRSYPIEDRSHAANALARVSQHGTPAEKKKVRAKVHAKYPTMGKPSEGEHGKSNAGPKAEGIPCYDKPEHHTDAIKEMGRSAEQGHGDGPVGYETPGHREQSGMKMGAPHHVARPVVGAHGFGHAAHQRHGHLRMSGHSGAHRIGQRKK